MNFDIKKLSVIAAIAILFGVFIFSLINAVYERPDYSDFCEDRPYPVIDVKETVDCEPEDSPEEYEINDCREIGGYIRPVYVDGCVNNYTCETCSVDYESAREKHDFFSFVVASLIGVFVVFLSIYLPFKSGSLKEFILLGLLIGGFAGIFISTGNYFSDMHRILKPIVILIEMILVIFVAHKKFKM